MKRVNYKFKFWKRPNSFNKERLETPSFRSPPKGAGVSNDKNGI